MSDLRKQFEKETGKHAFMMHPHQVTATDDYVLWLEAKIEKPEPEKTCEGERENMTDKFEKWLEDVLLSHTNNMGMYLNGISAHLAGNTDTILKNYRRLKAEKLEPEKTCTGCKHNDSVSVAKPCASCIRGIKDFYDSNS